MFGVEYKQQLTNEKVKPPNNIPHPYLGVSEWDSQGI